MGWGVPPPHPSSGGADLSYFLLRRAQPSDAALRSLGRLFWNDCERAAIPAVAPGGLSVRYKPLAAN